MLKRYDNATNSEHVAHVSNLTLTWKQSSFLINSLNKLTLHLHYSYYAKIY